MSSENNSPRIGVIGLGIMGGPMAANILKHHGQVNIYARNRAKQQALIEAGATWFDTPSELAEHSDALLLMVTDLPDVEQLLAGPDGILAGADELLLLIGSTSSPTGVQELGERLKRETAGRVRVVDCPVSGGEDGALAGTLSIMLGADEAEVALAQQVLEPCGTVVHLGPVGAGEVAKACNQLIVSTTILALGEAAVLAHRSGIDVEKLFALLSKGYVGSNLLNSRGQRIADEDYSPSGPAGFMVKDLGFANDVAEATETQTVLLQRTLEAFNELVSLGLGENDIAVTRKFIEIRGEHS